jgi:hypothetical protein
MQQNKFLYETASDMFYCPIEKVAGDRSLAVLAVAASAG